MRGHFAGVRAAVFCAAVLTGLVVVGSAFAVTVTAYSPTSGLPNKAGACPGNTIQLSGTGFAYDGAAASVSVSFGGGPNVDTFANGGLIQGSDTTLYAIVPDGALTGPITVTTAKGSASTASIPSSTTVGGSYAPGGTFYVNPCPQISLAQATTSGSDVGVPSTPSIYKVSPTKAKAGATVTITGTPFLDVTGVQLDGIAAKFVIVSPTSITFTVPKKAASGALTLTYSITASTSQGGTSPTNAAGNSSSAKSTQIWGGSKPKKFTVLK
jgi:hypothetical protein